VTHQGRKLRCYFRKQEISHEKSTRSYDNVVYLCVQCASLCIVSYRFRQLDGPPLLQEVLQLMQDAG
jgi:hypothetical protein